MNEQISDILDLIGQAYKKGFIDGYDMAKISGEDDLCETGKEMFSDFLDEMIVKTKEETLKLIRN